MNEKQHTKVYEFAERAEKFAGQLNRTTDEVLTTVSKVVEEVTETIFEAAEEARIKADQAVVSQVNKEDAAAAQNVWKDAVDKMNSSDPETRKQWVEDVIRNLFGGKGPL